MSLTKFDSFAYNIYYRVGMQGAAKLLSVANGESLVLFSTGHCGSWSHNATSGDGLGLMYILYMSTWLK